MQALFITALLAVSGSSERTRRAATALFERGAISATWAFLGRHSDPRVSWLRLVSITYEATLRFLDAWPASGALTIESMMVTLEACTNAAASRIPAAVRSTSIHRPLGVLTLLSYQERLQLLQCVQGALTPTHQCVLHATVERECAGTPTVHSPGHEVVTGIEQLELLLLGACRYTLGAPEEVARGRLAA
jgi:hypothetical protein